MPNRIADLEINVKHNLSSTNKQLKNFLTNLEAVEKAISSFTAPDFSKMVEGLSGASSTCKEVSSAMKQVSSSMKDVDKGANGATEGVSQASKEFSQLNEKLKDTGLEKASKDIKATAKSAKEKNATRTCARSCTP